MNKKEENCKQLVKRWKDLIPKIPKVSEGSNTPELRPDREERETMIRKLKKECWKSESLSRHDRYIIGEELYGRYKELEAITRMEVSEVGPIGEIRVNPKHIRPEDMKECIMIEKELAGCLEFLSDKSLEEISIDGRLDFKITQEAIKILVERKRLKK